MKQEKREMEGLFKTRGHSLSLWANVEEKENSTKKVLAQSMTKVISLESNDPDDKSGG